MLDLFTIFSKGGIVLWCFQGTSQLFTPSVNALIRTVILQERGGTNNFSHDGLTLKYRLDNEFELVFVVAYQKILDLSYVDKFLDDIHLEFRDKYKNELASANYFTAFEFNAEFNAVLQDAEDFAKTEANVPKKMKTFDESLKSKKTVASMIENKKDDPKHDAKTKNVAKKDVVAKPSQIDSKPSNGVNAENLNEDEIMKNRMKMFEKIQGKGKKTADKSKSPNANGKDRNKKSARIWSNAGTNKDGVVLDFSKKSIVSSSDNTKSDEQDVVTDESKAWVGKMKGEIKSMDYESDSEEDEEPTNIVENKKAKSDKKSKTSGFLGMFKGLVGSKSITIEDMEPVLNKLRDHMIAKNVASDISDKLCDSVAAQLEGKVLGTFSGVAATVKSTLVDALVKLLSPRYRVDILRDVMEAQKKKRPYVSVFCGVNGVGKSTNLAKIAFWLIENNFRVLIAACDTFRAGAVEQLRTHTRHLNALHPPDAHNNVQMVQLYEKGYGKDAAGIAMEAVNYARDCGTDVVLVDTAGRMQDNEPLMRSLSKLIKVNEPDLVLFVGEALVGNEAVDQLTKFNQALADHSNQENPHLIDGIVLTKFDTIDDKVGAAISMTYITGQPIVFVGTGQTYTDLKNLNPKTVVQSLMK